MYKEKTDSLKVFYLPQNISFNSDPRNSPDFLQSPELLTMINNQPGSRSSVGTLSTSVSSYQKNEYPPYPTPTFLPQFQRNQTHPQQNYSRPGYVTLPRRQRCNKDSLIILEEGSVKGLNIIEGDGCLILAQELAAVFIFGELVSIPPI